MLPGEDKIPADAKAVLTHPAIAALEAGATLPLDVINKCSSPLLAFLLLAVRAIRVRSQCTGHRAWLEQLRSFQPDCLEALLSVLDPKAGHKEAEVAFICRSSIFNSVRSCILRPDARRSIRASLRET